MTRPRIVIVGAGFGGLFAAQALARVDAEVTVVDRHNYHLFQPLLYQVATGGLSPANIAAPLRWIRAQAGRTLRLVAVDDVDYFRSDAKYTLVAWRDGGKAAEALVRTPLKDLLEQLDPKEFVQVHRSVVVNLRAISHVRRHDNETAEIHLKGRDDVLPVSRSYVHLFRQM